MKKPQTPYEECEQAIKELIRREGAVKAKIQSAFKEFEEIQHIKQDILLMLALPEEQYKRIKENSK